MSAAWESVRPGGSVLIVNQGGDEHAAQLEMATALGIAVGHAARFESPLFHYSLPRFVISAQKPAS